MQDGSPHYASNQLSPGTRLNGIYEIDHLMATGGMGEVYKGHTVQTGDAVAIKVLHPEYAKNDAALGLFRREASSLHNLHHEAIVRYYVFTIEPALGRPYLAMEFVEGQSLAELIRREALTYEAVRALLKRVAAGLHVAHERGIIHRDVSSDNIMIPGGDVARAKIIDFGIARSTQLSEGTIIGSGFAGKYNYVSPEQLGLFGGDVQAKSDIYSLGLVLVEALTGQPIDMGGSQAAILEKRRKVPDLGAIDLRIRPLIAKMLDPDPAARPESMAQVATWPLPTSRPNDDRYAADFGRSDERRNASSGRTKWLAFAAACGLIAIGGGAAYYVLQPGLPGPSPPVVGRAEQITRYINSYDGGDCFFITPNNVTASAARIDGYGASAAPFERLDDAFKSTHGFEADIDVRQITAAQCPALSFVGRLRQNRDRAPQLQINETSLRSGQALTGTVQDGGNGSAQLLLVSEEGAVQDLSGLLKRAGDKYTFNLRMQRTGAPGAQPQLLLAISSERLLETVKGAQGSADKLFPLAGVEVARSAQSVGAAIRYFKLDL